MLKRTAFLPSFALICFALLLGACQQSPGGSVKVLLGATVTTDAGTRPIEDAVIVITGSKFTAVGTRSEVPVPQASDRTDLTGKWIVPAPESKIAPGEYANLLVLEHAPTGIRPASDSDISARIKTGDWALH